MSPRLRRALQGGGVTSRIRADTWGVWRRPDRRGRMIGTISGADIDLLRLRDCLKPVGDKLPLTLAWVGPVDPVQTGDAQFAIETVSAPSRSLLDLLLRDRVSAIQRDQMRQACQAYLADLEQIASGGSQVTMNWDRLSRVDKTINRSIDPHRGSSRERRKALIRLNGLADRLTETDLRFLEALVLREDTRTSLSKRFALRPSLAEQRGLTILRALLTAYQSELRPPN